ncbi:NAD(P)/FAD-dependent oxidoreductase [Amycolatopsis rhabdoformis]|uniref:Pyridine nucleotide-disulfide oxidoreductase domain-containing protein 2 n=1 Tax=Amycolatopsis rhabdoformis TaxID=1448059 RepID=A0ABZ1HYV8_9PSEU|nr:NAD(P)/FAD-dependent oxidoreductase [Amycolatopsis rhabdoformis]WSE26811.1 NAD(P)/FAD-dependent oxidoreductase [Amycolatopsis rhabdoformis]
MDFDVIFVGAGHNALVAAAYLAKAGRAVCLLEQGDRPGGLVRSEELTLPGFLHDTYSAVHPSFAGGPAFAELGADLARHGLRYVSGGVSTGSSLPDGSAAVIATDPEVLGVELGRLGEQAAWNGLVGDVAPHLEPLFTLLGTDLTTPEAAHLLGLLRRDTDTALPFGALLAGNAHELITERFRSEQLRMAMLPWLPHFGIGPQDSFGALWAALLPVVLPAGNPQPVGGSGKLADALAALVREHGGEIRTRARVDAVLTSGGRATGVRVADGSVLSAHQVIASTTPDVLYGHLLRDADVPAGVRAQAARYRFRRGCLQLNLALSARPRFADARLDQGGCHNLGRGVGELLRSTQQAEAGYLPEHPTISWHEPTAVDPSRAPAGQAVVRMQILDVPLAPIGDAADQIDVAGEWTPSVAQHFADRVLAEAALHVKGLDELVLARHVLSPADLARANPSTGPGDHAAGHNGLAQAFTQRPIPAHRGGYATTVDDLYLIGAASWPGSGVTGASGRAIARRLLG